MKENEKDKRLKNNNFMDSCKHAIDGLIYAITTQNNIKKQLIIAIMIVILSLFYPFTTTEFLCLVFAIVFVIFAEMINTAIETLVDLYIDVYHPKAKIAKDVGAGAVLLMSINSVIVAYFLFIRETNLTDFGKNVFSNMVSSPVHLAFVGVILTLILAIIIKAIFKVKKEKNKEKKNQYNLQDESKNEKLSKDKLLENENIQEDRINEFEPSSQSAIAGAIITAIGFNTNNLLIFVFSLVLALLVLENRIENRKKSISGVIFGTFMGILIVLLVYGLNIFKT